MTTRYVADVTNYDDTIDTRDAQATIDRLFPWKIEDHNGDQHDEYKTQEEAEAYMQEHPHDTAGLYLIEDSDESQLLADLYKLRDQVDGGEWDSGATLVRDSHFRDYAQQYADDIHGNAVRDATWPFDHIDWDTAADELQMDYTELDFGGEIYWVR